MRRFRPNSGPPAPSDPEGAETGGPASPPPERPTIRIVNGEIKRIVDEAEAALMASDRGLYQRGRRAPQLRTSELALHTAVVALLRKLAKPDWQWAHYPAGELRDPRVAAKLKAMGTKAGWPDIMAISPAGIFHALELKATGGELSDSQELFRMRAIRNGIAYCVARSLDEVLTIFGHWGCIMQVRR